MNRHELAEYCRVPEPVLEAERAGREVLALPVHAALPFDDAHRIGKIVGDFLAEEDAAR